MRGALALSAWLTVTGCGRHDTPVASYFPAQSPESAGAPQGEGGSDSVDRAGAGGAAGEPALVCPDSYTITISGSGSRYRHVQSGRRWVDAELDCEREGQHLIVIDDAVENAWLATLASAAVTDKLSTNQLMWLGAGDSRSEGRFEWVTGQAVSLAFWSSAGPEPNSLYGDEDCAEMRDGGDWNDDRCDVPLTYVCECDGASARGDWCDSNLPESCGDCRTACSSGQTCMKQQCR